MRRLEQVAKDFNGKVLFAVSDKKLLQESDLGEEGAEVVVLTDQSTQYVFKFPHKVFNVENVRSFVKDFVDGKLRPHVKSEPVPESNDDAVKTVVGETFNSLVLDNDKDVFVEFYAPWCGHCKSLAPKWEELAQKLSHVSTLTVAKMDATANDWPKAKFAVSGYPTIFLKTASGDVLKYEGGREVKEMTKYLEKHVTHRFGDDHHSDKEEKKDKKRKER